MTTPLTAASMEATIRRYYDGCNRADGAMMKSTMAPEATHYFPAGAPQGPFRGAQAIADGWIEAVAKMGSQWTIETLILDPAHRRAVLEWTHWKTNDDTYLRGDEWFEFDEQGRIKEIRAYYACPPKGVAGDAMLGGFDHAGRGYTMNPPYTEETRPKPETQG